MLFKESMKNNKNQLIIFTSNNSYKCLTLLNLTFIQIFRSNPVFFGLYKVHGVKLWQTLYKFKSS